MNLVTGGTGFLGAHIVARLLQEKKQVRILKRKGSSIDEFNYILSYFLGGNENHAGLVEWVNGDILDMESLEEALEGVKTVYHSAALVSYETSRAMELLHVNAEGTANLVNACLRIKDIRFCHISSIAALGKAKAGGLIDEDSHWNESMKNTGYAVSKYRAEMEVWRGIEEGLDAVILNPGVIIGTGDWRKGSASLFRLIARGFPFYSEGVTGYIDVRDVAEAAVRLAESGISAQRYVAVAENLSYRDYFNLIADAMGVKRPSVKVNRWMSALAWRYFAFAARLKRKSALITRETARSSQETYRFSSEKIKAELGLQFIPVKDSVLDTARNYKTAPAL